MEVPEVQQSEEKTIPGAVLVPIMDQVIVHHVALLTNNLKKIRDTGIRHSADKKKKRLLAECEAEVASGKKLLNSARKLRSMAASSGDMPKHVWCTWLREADWLSLDEARWNKALDTFHRESLHSSVLA